MSNKFNIPYKTFARKETHPARLAALARLYGISSAPAERCQVFEIGCGDGGNIIPLAVLNPESRYLGIDSSQELIALGRERISELGLGNIELIADDILNYRPATGEYDYVICHGVYSWVSPEAQRAILQKGATALAQQGLFFISYNTLPGWRQRGAVRDIMRVGASFARGIDERERVAAALSFLEVVAESSPNVSAYVREAAIRLRNSDPSYLSQEFLGEYNTPLLFTEFMNRAKDARLQFVSEARVAMMSYNDLSPQIRDFLASLGSDEIKKEQALDMARNRTFRETVLCHESLAIDRGMSSQVFRQLYFVANYTPVEDGSIERVRFIERATGREVVTPAGECATILSVIAECGVMGTTIQGVSEVSASRIALSEHELMQVVVTLWKTGFVDAVTAPLGGMGEYAQVTSLARAQAITASKVTSVLHESFALSEIERRALNLLESPMSFSALETLLLASAPREEAQGAVKSLRQKGFFL